MLLLLLLGCNGSLGVVDIVAPADGALLREGEPLLLSAQVDADTSLAELGFTWSAEPGGELTGTPTVGTDQVTLVPDQGLLSGVVTLRLVVKDDRGRTVEDSVEVSVLPNDAPEVDFRWPQAGARVAADVPTTLWVTCGDADEADPSVLPLVWQGVDDGDEACGAAGVASATARFTEVGAGRVGVSVLDASGAVGTASIELQVVDGDADGDGHAGGAWGGDDCDDGDPEVLPGMPEACDGVDQDCDGEVDEDPVSGGWPDADGDGHGDPNGVPTCDGAPTEDDCDDADPNTYAGAPEICDSRDNDCDDDVDEDVTGVPVWYDDADGDGWGDDATAVSTCSPAAGQVLDGGDCDDADASAWPGAAEYCDGADDDCDGDVDEVGALDGDVVYRDADRDGHGVSTTTALACDVPWGYAATADDCDDGDAASHPGATEVCESGADEDCDGEDPACRPTGTTSLASADAKLTGVSGNDIAGYIAWLGDTSGDGIDDAVVGAWGRASGAGAAYVVEGPWASGTASLSTADAALTGSAASDGAGFAVAGPGDVNSDTFSDVLVGAPGAGTEGKAYLVYGPVTSGALSGADVVFSGEDADDFAGFAVGAAGDVDGDGDGDVLVGAYGDDAGGSLAGAAYLWCGPAAGARDLSAATAKLVGEDADDYAGYSVSGAGDVDGDGQADVLVGAPQAGGKGAAYLLYGPVSGTVDLSTADAALAGRTAEDWAGSAVRGAGDVDGDGHDDVLVGAYQNDTAATTAGAAYLFLGPLSGSVAATSADASFTGEDADDRAGFSVAGGDVDGDGLSDVFIGGYYEDAAGTGAGAAWLLYGPVTGAIGLGAADAKWTGETARDSAGRSVDAGGDADGDGFGDLLIGATGEGSAAAGAGAAYLVLGGGG